MRVKLPRNYTVCRLTLKGGDVGDAYDRERMGCMSHSSKKLTITEPLENYPKFAAATIQINVDKFWCSTLEEQDAEISELLDSRIHPVGIGGCSLEWDDVSLPSQKKRRLDYDTEYEKYVRLGSIFLVSVPFMSWSIKWEVMGALWWIALLSSQPNCQLSSATAVGGTGTDKQF